MFEENQVTGKIVVETADGQAAMAQFIAALQQMTAKMNEGFKAIGDASKSGSQTIADSSKAIGTNFEEAANKLKEGASGITSSITSILTPFSLIKEAILGVTAIFAGLTAMFLSSAKDVDEWNRNSLSMARILGITTQEASALKVAMENIAHSTLTDEVGTQTLARAMTTLNDKIRDNAGKMKDLGVVWKGTLFDTFLGACEAYQNLTTASLKADFGSEVFGKRLYQQLRPVLSNLSSDTIPEFTKKTEEMGREVGGHALTASLSLSMASLHLHEAWQTLHSHLATVGIPIWGVIKEILAGIVSAINKAIDGVVGLANAMSNAVNACSRFAIGLSNVLQKLGRIITDSASAEAGLYALQKAALPADLPKTPEPKKDEPGAPPQKAGGGGGKGGGEGSIVQEWKAQLDQLKQEDKNFQDQSLQMQKTFWASHLAAGKVATKEEEDAEKAAEKAAAMARLQYEADYWKDKLELCDAGTKEYNAVLHEIVILEQGINKARLQSEIDLIKSKMDANKASLKDREALLDQEEKLGKIDLEIKKENAKHEAQIGTLNKTTELQEYRKLLAEEQAADLKREERRLELIKKYLGKQSAEYKAFYLKIEVMKKQQSLDLIKADDAVAEAQASSWGQVFTGITGAFGSAMESMMKAGANFGQIMANLGQSILNVFVKLIETIVEKWLMGFIAELIGAKTTATAQIATLSGPVYMENLLTLIPEVGPYAAPAVAGILTGVAVGIAEGLTAAAGGWWEVPRTTLTQLHPQEMVLPADKAAGLRQMIDGGGGGGGGGTYHITIQTLDAQSVKTFCLKHSDSLAHAVNRVFNKNGKPILGPAYR